MTDGIRIALDNAYEKIKDKVRALEPDSQEITVTLNLTDLFMKMSFDLVHQDKLINSYVAEFKGTDCVSIKEIEAASKV